VRGNTLTLLLARVDLRWRSEKSQAVSNIDDLIVGNLPIRTARYDFKKVPIWTNRRRRDMT
jgi:hypothetical protein